MAKPTDPYKCPKCNSALVLKEGQYGRFMACPGYPDCQYTRALWTFTTKPPCEKCNGTQLLPFMKDGKIISHTFIHCDCYEETEFHYPLKSGDFDFPCSYTYRAYEAYINEGVELPSLYPRDNGRLDEFEDRLSLIETKSPSVRRHELEQIKGEVVFLHNKVAEMRAEKKKRSYKYD